MIKDKAKPALLAAALACLLASNGAARAEIIRLKADLKGSEETPPTASAGVGALTGTYDTDLKKLSWKVIYSGLTSPAISAHFHGPAAVGKPGPIVVPAPVNVDKEPLEGSVILTETQAEDLLAGAIYFNIHTETNKAGEIRGQVLKAK